MFNGEYVTSIRGQEPLLYTILYGAGAMLSMMACCYLLFRRANAIAPDVTSSVRLRRWTAAFFASMTLSYAWYLPIGFLTSSEDIMMSYLVGAVLDFLTLIPLAIVLLFVMLQDRRRPLWPVGVMVAPVVAGLVACIVTRGIALLSLLYAYYLLLGIGLTIYMVHAIKQYDRWLRDNYADLEHKEVRQSLVVLAIILLAFSIYSFSYKSLACRYISQVNCMVLVFYLLWRVETLSDLSLQSQDLPIQETSATDAEMGNDNYSYATEQVSPEGECKSSDVLPSSFRDNIEPLLKEHCEQPKLYLQYDISANALARLIGTNRVYLSKHFTLQGTTYNAYINGLRIRHFINLYREAVTNRQPIIAKQLAYQSGFRSYSTFSAAFKQIMGMTVTKWMSSQDKTD